MTDCVPCEMKTMKRVLATEKTEKVLTGFSRCSNAAVDGIDYIWSESGHIFHIALRVAQIVSQAAHPCEYCIR